MTGDGERGDDAAGGSSSGSMDESAADSLLQEIARAPGLTPAGSTLESSSRDPLTATLAPGLVIAGRFRLEKRLGEGGMGVVWSAVHVVTRKPVALKFLTAAGRDSKHAVQRFLREARAACAVRHPSVVEVHDVLELEGGAPVMVMELLAGETLADRLQRERVMSLPDIARIMVHVCSAIGCAHALGIVHRDLKPENIFLAISPSGQEVKVLDFGIAKLTASEGDAAHSGAITGTGAILGTPYYMAPEQLFGEKDIDHRADIWALGIIFYEALTGQRPTQGQNVGQIYKIVVTGAIVPFRDRAGHLPGPFVEMVDRMLSRDRTQRPADASAVLSVVADYTSESFVAVTSPPVAPARLEGESDPGPANAISVGGEGVASTSDATLRLNRTSASGAEVPAPPSAGARSRAPVWAVLGLVAVAVLATAGRFASRARDEQGPASGTPAGLIPERSSVPAVTATVTILPAPSVPAVSAGPSASATATDGSSTRAAATTRLPARAATLAAPPRKPVATALRETAPPASVASSSRTTPTVDPGSYQ